MESKATNRKIIIGLAVATGAVVASYLFYNYFIKPTNKYKSSQYLQQIRQQVINEAKKIGKVHIDKKTKTFSFDRFIEIFKLIRKFAQNEIEDRIQNNQQLRRNILRNGGENEEYRLLVLRESHMEERIYQKYSDIILKELKIPEEVYVSTQSYILAQTQYQSRFFALTQEKPKISPNNKTKVKLTKEQTIEIFKSSEQFKIEAMQYISECLTNQEEIDYSKEMIVQEQLMKDKLFLKWGVEQNEFQDAMIQYNLYNDAAIIRIMEDNFKGVSPEVMSMMMSQMQLYEPQKVQLDFQSGEENGEEEEEEVEYEEDVEY